MNINFHSSIGRYFEILRKVFKKIAWDNSLFLLEILIEGKLSHKHKEVWANSEENVWKEYEPQLKQHMCTD